jgi:hypothetical protein
MIRRLIVASATVALLFANLAGASVGAAGPSGPALSAIPGKTDQGATVRLTGSGFAGECGVLFYWGKGDGLVLGGTDVSADGTFAADISVPADSRPGANKIEARGRVQGLDGCAEDSGTVATANVSVTASQARGVPPIALLNRVITAQGVDRATIAKAKASGQSIHAIVQLYALPQAGDLDTLAALGVKPLAYLNAAQTPGTAYIAALAPTVADRDARFTALVRAVHPLLAVDKVDAGLAAKLDAGAAAVDSIVLFFGDVSVADAEAVLARHGAAAARTGDSTTYGTSLNADQVQLDRSPASTTSMSRARCPTSTPSSSSTCRAPRTSG